MGDRNYVHFFDDRALFKREGLERTMGKPEEIEDAAYSDGVFSTDYRTGFVFNRGDAFFMIYFGKRISDKQEAIMIASSSDGIHFSPHSTELELELEGRIAPNEIMKLEKGSEIADIYEDRIAPEDERYKMLVASAIHNFAIDGLIFVSADLIHWHPKKTEQAWNGGCEPITGVFYNRVKKCHTIMRRPLWGTRSVGYVETQDFSTFTDYEPCMQVDSMDAVLDEMYGMSVMDYHGMFIGFNVIYGNIQNELGTKFRGGSIYAQLSYSHNGRNWQRMLRTPFLALNAEGGSMLWITSALVQPDGSVILCTSATPHAHGDAFNNPQDGRIRFYRVRKDGFMCLKTSGMNPGTVATRECLWQSGELEINLKAEHATVALYENASTNGSHWGTIRPIPGFGHDDCKSFSGDSTNWRPEFKGGSTEALSGRTIIIEVHIENGEIYALSGGFIPVTNIQALRYRAFGEVPKERII